MITGKEHDVYSNFANHPRVNLGDNNGDGVIDVNDMPFEPGSLGAKKAWIALDAEAHSDIAIAKAKAAGFNDAVGWYQNKPLIEGKTGPVVSNWQYVVNKLIHFDGLEPSVAKKIANRTMSVADWME